MFNETFNEIFADSIYFLYIVSPRDAEMES